MAEQIKTANTNTLTKANNAQIITYEVQGQSITLTPNIVRNQLTNNNRNITDDEIGLFMELCKYQKLNPFLREAFLIKYDNSKPAQQIVSLAAFQRIADSNDAYDGIEDGIVVQKLSDGSVIKREGCILYKNEILVGGWATVYRKDRKIPIKAQLALKEYSKAQATWNSSPAMMIDKCAKVAALRKAFPQNLGSAYSEDEIGGLDVQSASKDNESIKDDISYDIDDCNFEEEIVEEVLQEPQSTSTTNGDTPQAESTNDVLEMPYVEYMKQKDKYEKVGYVERDGVKFARVKKI